MRKKASINQEHLELSSEILRAIAHPLRMRILGFIDEHGATNVNRIYNTLKLEQSITSQHLRILRMAGLVDTEREGKYIHYSICYDKIGSAIDSIRRFLKQSQNQQKGARI